MGSIPLKHLLKIGGEALTTTATTLSGAINELVTAIGTITTALSGKANAVHTHTASDVSGLATVATTNSYNDLDDKPETAGSLNDLSDVDITDPASGQVLGYDGESFKNIDFNSNSYFVHKNSNGVPDIRTISSAKSLTTITFDNISASSFYIPVADTRVPGGTPVEEQGTEVTYTKSVIKENSQGELTYELTFIAKVNVIKVALLEFPI